MRLDATESGRGDQTRWLGAAIRVSFGIPRNFLKVFARRPRTVNLTRREVRATDNRLDPNSFPMSRAQCLRKRRGGGRGRWLRRLASGRGSGRYPRRPRLQRQPLRLPEYRHGTQAYPIAAVSCVRLRMNVPLPRPTIFPAFSSTASATNMRRLRCTTVPVAASTPSVTGRVM